MTPDERTEAAARKWADAVNEAIEARVQLALALERDRQDAAIGELRAELDTAREQLRELQIGYRNHLAAWHGVALGVRA